MADKVQGMRGKCSRSHAHSIARTGFEQCILAAELCFTREPVIYILLWVARHCSFFPNKTEDSSLGCKLILMVNEAWKQQVQSLC